MDDDQQFCLRWNNHQSTLISVFDTLLENQTLVDCTLAAEGKFLKAHKVVLSACSPYFATLLQEQYDKHPIFILKDVKFQELRAMMDYMYRGEVNISQDQLAALLKAAESLQIKGLSDNRSTGNINPAPKLDGAHQQHRNLNVGANVGIKIGGGYTLEQTKRTRLGPNALDVQEMSGSREGSSSPSRRRKKVRRRSIEASLADIQHDNSNSSLQQQSNVVISAPGISNVNPISAAASVLAAAQLPSGATPGTVVGTSQTVASSSSSAAAAAAAAVAAANIAPGLVAAATQQMLTNVTKKTESVKGASASSEAMNTEDLATGVSVDEQEQHQTASKVDKHNHKYKATSGKDTSDIVEPKSEYDDDGNEGTVEDLTLDEEDMGIDDLDQNAGTSHVGEGSSQGYAPWQHERSQDDLLMTQQDAQQRDPQDLRTSLYNFEGSLKERESSAHKDNMMDITATGSAIPTRAMDFDINKSEFDLNENWGPEISLSTFRSNNVKKNCAQLKNTHDNDGFKITAAAASASFQLANLIGNRMLMPHVLVENVASTKAAAAAAHLASVYCNTKSPSTTTNHVCNSKIKIKKVVANSDFTIATLNPKKSSVQFNCEFCAFTCSWKYDLKLHLRQKHVLQVKGEHNNSTLDRFPCDVCGKSYLRKRHLQRHMRDECIGIPPRFSCELCSSRFRRKYHMVRHLTSKHNIPHDIAQQATGGGTRHAANHANNNNSIQNGSIDLKVFNLKMESTNKSNSDVKNNGGAENLTLRKDLFGGCGQNETDNQKNGENMSTSPAHSGGAYSSSGTHSPMAGHFLMPFCGLSGAITAIPANAGAGLEYDKSIYANVKVKETINVKAEPLSPTKVENLALSVTTDPTDADNQVDEDWKLKLSMQLISNSLLKERLINNLTFSAGYNSNN